MSELLSQRQFAERIGRSNVWVSKLVKQGKLPVINGKIPLIRELLRMRQANALVMTTTVNTTSSNGRKTGSKTL